MRPGAVLNVCAFASAFRLHVNTSDCAYARHKARLHDIVLLYCIPSDKTLPCMFPGNLKKQGGVHTYGAYAADIRDYVPVARLSSLFRQEIW